MLSKENAIGVELGGIETILLSAVTGSFANWPFENGGARSMAKEAHKENRVSVLKSVRTQWLATAGLPKKTRDWTPELIRAAGEVPYRLVLTRAEWDIVRLAIQACKEEFHASWWEFLCVFGGALYEFDLGIEALDGLLERVPG